MSLHSDQIRVMRDSEKPFIATKELLQNTYSHTGQANLSQIDFLVPISLKEEIPVRVQLHIQIRR